jgi:uncharacterized protein DUF6526
MKEQNFKNHGKWVIGYHAITFLAIFGLIVGSIRHLVVTTEENIYPATLLVLVAFILFFIFYFVRVFALKAQDRAIRAEEKFRYYILTGKTLSDGLTIRQIIGLRFASDKEFPALAEKAEKENLSEKEIKKAIQNWKADTYRA